MPKTEVGPIDARLLEPIKYVILHDDKGIIQGVKVQHGYAYRGMEKIVKGKQFLDAAYFVERICGICTATHSTNFCQGIESIMGIDIPKRAAYIRTVSLELERIHSHFLILSEIMHSIEEHSLQVEMLKNREAILGLFEKLSGSRVLHSMATVGGVKRNILPTLSTKILKVVGNIENNIQALIEQVNSPRISPKIRGKGVIDIQSAYDLGAVGPVARASGVKLDIRKALPYAAYGDIPFSLVIETDGDTWARTMVRLGEILESAQIIKTALYELPNGVLAVEPSMVKGGCATSRTEAPRGELLHFTKLSDRGFVEMFHLRTPTKANINLVERLVIGSKIEDYMLLATTLDPCIACFDSAMVRF